MKRSIYLVAYLMLAVFLGGALVVNAEVAEAKTLNFALVGNPDTLDPHKTSGTLTFQTLKSLYDTLAEPDRNGKIVPALAERWEISDDALVWSFYLKKDVVFHNGDKLTSKDVKATFERIMDKTTGSPKAKEFKSIVGIETPEDFTVIGHTGKLDPDGTLAGYGTEGRYVKWINPRTAELIADAGKVSGFENRKKMYDEALEIMAKEVPFMYLGSSYRYTAVRKNVSDFRMTPNLDTFDFRWTEMAQ